MIIKELRERIAEINEDAVVFDNPSFDKSIVGMSEADCVIYDYDLMIEEFMQDNNIEDPIEAIEFIDYNTIRALEYTPGPNMPIILFRNDFEDYTRNVTTTSEEVTTD